MYITPFAAVQLTPKKVQQRAVRGTVTILKDTKNKISSSKAKGGAGQSRAIFLRVSLKNNQSSHLYHSSLIRIYGSTKDPKQYLMRPDSRLWVHCRCPFFTYYCEQALMRIKATSRYDCVPGLRVADRHRQRNPDLVPYLCKHLFAAVLSIMKAEQNQKDFKPFVNKRNPYDGDYNTKLPPSYSK